MIEWKLWIFAQWGQNMEKNKSHCNISKEIWWYFSSNFTYSFDFFSDNFHFVFVFSVIFTNPPFFLQNLLFYRDVCQFHVLSSVSDPDTEQTTAPTFVTCWSRVGHVSQWIVFHSPRCTFFLRCAACFCGVQSEVFSLRIPESPCSQLNTGLIRWIICLNSQNSNKFLVFPSASQVLCV